MIEIEFAFSRHLNMFSFKTCINVNELSFKTHKVTVRQITPKKRENKIYPKDESLPENIGRVRMNESIEYSFQLLNLKIFKKSIFESFLRVCVTTLLYSTDKMRFSYKWVKNSFLDCLFRTDWTANSIYSM